MTNEANKQRPDETANALAKALDAQLSIDDDHITFVSDQSSIEFLKKSKVVFIVRRAPNAVAESTSLVERIKKTYASEANIVCIRSESLEDAAEQKANDACRNSLSPIIYEDTTETLVDLKELAKNTRPFNYFVLVAQPKASTATTTGKVPENAEPHEVSATSTASATTVNLLNEFELAVPYFYCWYVSPTDSNHLIDTSKGLFDECIGAFAPFKENCALLQLNEMKEAFNFKRDTILHCTAKYLGNNLKENARSHYFSNPIVRASTAKIFDMKVTGFTFTNRTIGAVVSFDHPDVRTLWNNDLEEGRINEILTDVAFQGVQNPKELIDQLQFADRAHVTLALASNEQAVTTGIDLIKIKLIMLLHNKHETQKINGNEFILIDQTSCLVNLEKPLLLKTIFSGDYYEF